MQARLRTAKSSEEVLNAVRNRPDIANQPDIKTELNLASDSGDQATADHVKAMVDMGAMAEKAQASSLDRSQAAQIKESPLYSDRGFTGKRNWLSDALDRLKNLHGSDNTQQVSSSGGADIGWLGPFLVGAIWVILGAGVLVLLYYAVRFIDWRRTLTRKTKTLLEEDEPERTLDEWLQLADEYAAAGRYREAVRSLYLACLIKFDENSVARFERGETNWEHLARINASANLPTGLDFTEPTRRFDRIWYGHQVRGQADVDEFRAWYQQISARLEPLKAAA